jgi:hypothetical protein
MKMFLNHMAGYPKTADYTDRQKESGSLVHDFFGDVIESHEHHS